MEIRYRKAESQDEAAIRQLFVEMLQTIYRRKTVEGYPPGYLNRFFSGGTDCIYVAETSDGIVGFLSLECHRQDGAPFVYVDDFSVGAPFRGKGIGSHLLDLAERYATEQGIAELHLHVERKNQQARHLYAHRGFMILEETETRLLLGKTLETNL